MTPSQDTHYGLLKKLKDFEFSRYERQVLELILDKSFGQGRTQAYFPRLECIVVLTRISRGNVSSTINSLIRARVLEKCGTGVYAVRLPVEQWAVASRLVWTAAVRELDQWLNQDPKQTEMADASGMLGVPPSLSQALREMAIDFPAECRDHGKAVRRNVGQAMRSGTGVPESGTGVPDSGTLSVSASESGPADAVPDSGTPPTYRRNNVSSKERLTSIRPPVPDSGTPGASQPDPALKEKVRTFVGERDWRKYWEWQEYQDIFTDPLRSGVLAGSLRYCQAGLREGIRIEKTPGAMLWADYKQSLARRLTREGA